MSNRFYTMKSWLDRVVQFPNRRKYIVESQSAAEIVGTFERMEGTVTEAGDVLDATTLNAFENRIDTAFTGVQTDIDTYKAYVEQGTVNSLNFTGLLTGKYVCSYSENSTGAPNTSEGICTTVINQNTSYGAQTAISDTGYFYRKYSGGAWGAWQQFENIGNKVTSLSASSTNTQYPSAKVVFDSLVNLRLSGNNVSWKDSQDGCACWFFYEGANTTTLDLPSGNCVVLVLKKGNNRGYALAFGWVSGSNAVWHNNLHDSWKGWNSLH